MGREELHQIDDALRYVRSHPEMFFSARRFSSNETALLLAREALQAGAQSVEVVRAGSWVVVHSPSDWLGKDAPTSFHRIVPFPQGGDNAMRMEILTTAFTEAVITKVDGKVEEIIGAADPSILEGYAERGRAVAFLAAE